MSTDTRPVRLLVTADAVGGVWQYATDLAGALGPLGYEIVLAVLGPSPSPQQCAAACAIPGLTLIETGLPLDWLARNPEEIVRAGRAIAALARSSKVDLVQLNQPALAAQTRFSVPVVAVSHSCLATWWAAVENAAPPADFAWRIALHGEGLRAADQVVAPSTAFAHATQRTYSLPAAPITIHNGRSRLAHPAAAMHDFAFTAGRLWDRGKNLATLNRAAARLGVPVKAIGPLSGPNGEKVAFDHLHTPGPMSEFALAGCLAARPVFVSAALYEPFGLAVLEAATAGCPLVLADIPTFHELWDEAATFIAPGDDAAFAAAIERLIGDVGMRLSQGEKARAVARRFTPDRMADSMATLYRRVLHLPAADRAPA